MQMFAGIYKQHKIELNYIPTLCSSTVFPVIDAAVIINFKRRRHVVFI